MAIIKDPEKRERLKKIAGGAALIFGILIVIAVIAVAVAMCSKKAGASEAVAVTQDLSDAKEAGKWTLRK